uniref:Geranylgeranyl transferase type-2 subunit alpha n=1 Tax=Hematodinium sp. SG-2015 TaxID=1649283 RepID=A0A0F7EVS1_9DINO|nr:geranylgeranyltransferase subunit alpha [Hematodinium sp. SG-2015]
MNHGRVKVEISEEQKAEQREKVRTGFALFEKLLDQRNAKVYGEQTYEATFSALTFNPEFATLWNYRREILEVMFSSAGNDAIIKLLRKELRLLNAALKKSHKAYCVWHHRRWIIQRILKHVDADALIDSELALVDEMFEADERNFHCWNYRAFLIDQCSSKRSNDAAMSEKMINRNFSNYSAWHLRSTIPNPPPITDEIEWLMQAIYTEPGDQSIWLYHEWLHVLDRSSNINIRLTHSFERESYLYLVFNAPVFGINSVAADGRSIEFDVVNFGDNQRLKEKPRIGRCIRIKNIGGGAPWTLVTDDGTYVLEAPPRRCDIFDARAWEDVYHEKIDKESLDRELANIDAFLEVEPESKYAIVAKIRLKMKRRRSLGRPQDELDEERTLTEQLKTLDPLRIEYYEENWRTTNILHKIQRWYSTIREIQQVSVLDLSGTGLSSFAPNVAFAMAGVRHLNIAQNQVTRLATADLLPIGAHLEILEANDNEIRQDLQSILRLLPRIKSLSLSNNQISWSSLENLPPSLEFLDLRHNPGCEKDPRLVDGVYRRESK